MNPVPEKEIRSRLAAFQARLTARGLEGALVTARTDRYYLSGTVQEGFLWVASASDPSLWILRDADRARAETPLPVTPMGGWRELWSAARAAFGRGRAGVVGDTLPVRDLGRLGAVRLDDVEDVSAELLALRSRKSPWEIGRMEEAGRIAAAVYGRVPEVLRPGMTEAELAGLLFARAMALGHEGLLRSRGGFEAYSWHVLSGPNAGLPGANDSPMSGEGPSPSFPVGAGDREIRRGEPVLVDFGICRYGYQTDQTRTFCLGPPPAWLRDAHRALDQVHRDVIGSLRAGVAAGEVFRAGVDRARAEGLPGYLGAPGKECRFVGHGVGLETAEPPILAAGSGQLLEEGMTVAVEPKAVIDGRGGVGVEDTLVIQRGSPRRITPMPQGLIEI